MALITRDTKLNKVRSFVDEIIGKLPSEEQAAARAKYSQAQDEISGLAQEIDTAVATVNDTATKQAAWYDKHKDVIEGRAGGEGNKIAAAVDADKIVKDLTSQITSTRDELAGQGLYLASVIPHIVAQHQAEFGEVLDSEKLVKDAVAAGTDLKTYYNTAVAPKRAEKAAAKAAADIAAAEARGRDQGLKEAGNGHIPFPVGNRTPTTLSGLRKPAAEAGRDQYTLEAAVATATDMIQKSGG